MYNPKESIETSQAAAAPAEASDWHWELTQLERGEPCAAAAMRVSGDVVVGQASSNHAALHRIRAPTGYISVIVGGGPFGALFVGGYRVQEDDCVVVQSDTEIETVTHRLSEVAWMAADERSCAEVLYRLRSRGLALGPGVHLVSCNGRSISGLHMRLTGAMQSRARTAEAGIPSLRQALADSLLDQVKRLADDPPLHYAERRMRSRRHAGVELACRYIRDHLADPISLADLCGHTHLRPRSLEYGFHEIMCLSPMSYVKVMRLNAVHRQLLSNAHLRRSISEIALDTGFRHLSQFAVDYKRLFLESPSATRRRVALAPIAPVIHRSTTSIDGPGRRARVAVVDSLSLSEVHSASCGTERAAPGATRRLPAQIAPAAQNST